jgi:hypothetical protein
MNSLSRKFLFEFFYIAMAKGFKTQAQINKQFIKLKMGAFYGSNPVP